MRKAAKCSGFITYASGPLEMNRCVGNLCWRFSALPREIGPTRCSATAIGIGKTYRLDEAARLRPEWLDGLKLAVSWCPTNLNLLDALAAKVSPNQVFIHLPIGAV